MTADKVPPNACEMVREQNPNHHQGWRTVCCEPLDTQLERVVLGVCLSRFEDHNGVKFATHYVQWNHFGEEPALVSGNYHEAFRYDGNEALALQDAVNDMVKRLSVM